MYTEEPGLAEPYGRRIGACGKCDAPAERQHHIQGPNGRRLWRCSECNASHETDLPFDPRTVPDGRTEILLAIQVLAIHVPVLVKIEPDLIYEIVRPYFNAGWCARDVLYALNKTPDLGEYPGDGAVAWKRGEARDRTLYRMQRRLRSWRFADGDNDERIMTGGYTEEAHARAVAREELADRQVARTIEYLQRADAARAVDSDAPAVAKMIAADAARLATRHRREADQRAAERIAEQARQARSASAVLALPEGISAGQPNGGIDSAQQ